ncbi:hypothetical protein T265_00369 [Opisthorchis viverrini]|uniref:Uncharacterized protein n=1 Tax=Opisthorchis viverrini TaxID=6198 RepID=A0A075AJT3_OPIVI|nr:hypothetical protein T265_00369 [Opisthorchis viverrini]KER33934.1 hypothetical protein T265_00369 [Opisthorchis viverrini]
MYSNTNTQLSNNLTQTLCLQIVHPRVLAKVMNPMVCGTAEQTAKDFKVRMAISEDQNLGYKPKHRRPPLDSKSMRSNWVPSGSRSVAQSYTQADSVLMVWLTTEGSHYVARLSNSAGRRPLPMG